ncbi:MAG TPA: hypothetical protein VFG87_10165 [Amycolatopsis sp.]|nr:hypothetical protein [Amycolatopsis sp.]
MSEETAAAVVDAMLEGMKRAETVSEGDRLVIVLRDSGWVARVEAERYPLLDELHAELRRVGLFDRAMVIVASNPADEIHVVRGGA